MPLIGKDDREFLRKHFNEQLKSEVKMVHFTQRKSPMKVPSQECTYCRETRQLLEELRDLSDKIKLEVYDFVADAEKARELGVDKIPATVLSANGVTGVRFYGIPSGYEFSSIIEDLMDLSRGQTDLPEDFKQELARVDRRLHVQVFVTPTCPYCPTAARLAHKMAMENRNITADVIEASEFPQLVVKYAVAGVPKVVIDERIEFEGPLTEAEVLREFRQALQPVSATSSPV